MPCSHSNLSFFLTTNCCFSCRKSKTHHQCHNLDIFFTPFTLFFFFNCAAQAKKKEEKRLLASVCKVCRAKPRCSSTPLLFFSPLMSPYAALTVWEYQRAESTVVEADGTTKHLMDFSSKFYNNKNKEILPMPFFVLFFCIVHINDNSLGKHVLHTTLCKNHI